MTSAIEYGLEHKWQSYYEEWSDAIGHLPCNELGPMVYVVRDSERRIRGYSQMSREQAFQDAYDKALGPRQTNDLLTRARALVDAITPGKWTLGDNTPYQSSVYGNEEMTNAVCCRVEPKDAAFIAAAPALVHDLCALAEAQQAEIERWRAAVDWWKGQMARAASLAKRNEAGELYAECEYCGATADVPANIQHTPDCYISQVELNFARTQRMENKHNG